MEQKKNKEQTYFLVETPWQIWPKFITDLRDLKACFPVNKGSIFLKKT